MPIPADERALARVIEWADDDEEWGDFRADVFDAHLASLLEEFGEDHLFERLGDRALDVVGAVMEDFLAARFGESGERNVVDEYLARRGWLEKKPATAYLRAVSDSAPSLYEVVDVDPGRSVTVRDLVRETDPVKVPHADLSEGMALWGCFVGRLVGADRARRFSASLLPFSRELARTTTEDVIAITKNLPKLLRRDARKRGEKVDISDLDAREFWLQSPMGPAFFTRVFVTWRLHREEVGPGALSNTDDEAFVPSTVRFPVTGSVPEVAAALDAVPEFDRADPGECRWSWRGRELPALKLPEEIAGDDAEAGAGRLALGRAEIVDGALLLHVNSVERAERGRDLVASRLGPLLGNPLTSHEDPAIQLRAAVDGPPSAPKVPDLPPEVVEAVVGAHLEQHYRQALDEPIPMLENRTPRRAAKTKKGRVHVTEWIKDIENGESQAALQQGRRPVDLSWLWGELGIPRPGGKP